MYLAEIYVFKVNNGNTRTMFNCSTLRIKALEKRHLSHSGAFTINFEQVSCIALVSVSLTLDM